MPSFRESSRPRDQPKSLMSLALAGGFFLCATSTIWESLLILEEFLRNKEPKIFTKLGKSCKYIYANAILQLANLFSMGYKIAILKLLYGCTKIEQTSETIVDNERHFRFVYVFLLLK